MIQNIKLWNFFLSIMTQFCFHLDQKKNKLNYWILLMFWTISDKWMGAGLYIHIAKLSQAKPQLQLSWLALASLNST